MDWNYQTLDQIFPFVVFVYGSLLTLILNTPKLMELAEEKLPIMMVQQFKLHRGIAFICLCVGLVWSLQNIWVDTGIVPH